MRSSKFSCLRSIPQAPRSSSAWVSHSRFEIGFLFVEIDSPLCFGVLLPPASLWCMPSVRASHLLFCIHNRPSRPSLFFKVFSLIPPRAMPANGFPLPCRRMKNQRETISVSPVSCFFSFPRGFFYLPHSPLPPPGSARLDILVPSSRRLYKESTTSVCIFEYERKLVLFPPPPTFFLVFSFFDA